VVTDRSAAFFAALLLFLPFCFAFFIANIAKSLEKKREK